MSKLNYRALQLESRKVHSIYSSFATAKLILYSFFYKKKTNKIGNQRIPLKAKPFIFIKSLECEKRSKTLKSVYYAGIFVLEL